MLLASTGSSSVSSEIPTAGRGKYFYLSISIELQIHCSEHTRFKDLNIFSNFSASSHEGSLLKAKSNKIDGSDYGLFTDENLLAIQHDLIPLSRANNWHLLKWLLTKCICADILTSGVNSTVMQPSFSNLTMWTQKYANKCSLGCQDTRTLLKR